MRLVSDLARRLADALDLPFLAVLEETRARPEQKVMENSLQQANNIDGALAVHGQPPPEPVLLVDDIVGSRWTLTVAAWVLRRRGSGEVWPLTLATLGRN